MEWEEDNNYDKFTVSLFKDATGTWPWSSRVFAGVFGTSSGTERPLLVKLPIKECVVKLVWFPDPSCVGGAREGREGRVW